MKIHELRLLAVGPFTHRTLMLGGGRQGLHLIYGPNEAGKSSALRAIRYLLYGFPGQLSDDFLHPYRNLRVGACLTNDAGAELAIIRRKANQKSLRDGNDEGEVSEELLQRFLGSASAELFCRSFGIDHQTLVEGGEEIVRGEGDLGRTLFSGSGIAHLKAIETRLAEEIAGLFAPRAQNPTINRLLHELKEARRQVRDLQLRPAEWERHYTALQEALQRQQQLEADRDRLRRDRDQLHRFRSALPRICEYQELQSEADQLSDAIQLPADFDQRRETVLRELTVAESNRQYAAEEIRQREERLAQLSIPKELLACSHRIDALERDLHRYQDAQADRPEVAANLRSYESQAKSVLLELGADRRLDEAPSLILPVTDRIRIQQLVVQYGTLVQTVDDCVREIQELDREIGQRQSELDGLPAPPDSSSLSRAVATAREFAGAESQRNKLRVDLKRECAEVDLERQRLPAWSGTLEELASLPVPVPETVERFTDDFREQDDARLSLDEQIRGVEQDAESCQRTLDLLRAEQDIPGEEQLAELRVQRNQGWRLARQVWRNPASQAAEVEAFLASIQAGSKPLEDAYEDLVRAADTIADRLRHEADRVAHHRQLQASSDRAHAQLQQLREIRRTRQEQRGQLSEQWLRLWHTAGIEPLTPREMRSWLQRHSALLDRARTIRELQRQDAELSRVVERERQNLIGALQCVSPTMSPAGASLQELLRLAQDTLVALQDAANLRRQTEHELERVRRDQQRKLQAKSQADVQLQRWKTEWQTASCHLPRVSADQPAAANEVLELLHQLSLKLTTAEQQRARLQEIDDFAARLAQQVCQLAQQVASDLTGDQPLENVASEILSRHRVAGEADKERKRLQKELQKRLAACEEAAAKVQQLGTQLEQLRREAGCQSADELTAAWRRSEQKRRVTQRMDQLRTELRELSSGMPLERFVSQTRSQDPDALPIQIEQLEREVATLDDILVNEIGQTIGREQIELRQMDSSAQAAEVEERSRDLLLSLSVAAQEYALLQVAQIALGSGIDRYRERHQGPILRSASDVFARLTAGSFQELKVDYGAGGKPVVMGVRRESQDMVPVTGMSDGTADQLYFALRYAWVLDYLDRHESLPFVVDDILIRFDNDRARETLRVLGDLSQRTQVLFFTHHWHLVEFARTLLPDTVLFIHELTRA